MNICFFYSIYSFHTFLSAFTKILFIHWIPLILSRYALNDFTLTNLFVFFFVNVT